MPIQASECPSENRKKQIFMEDTMDRREYLMDKIDEKEDLLYDLKQAGEWDAARAVQQDLADLYHSLEMAA